MKKRGRKKLWTGRKDDEYYRGYHAGWERVKRKSKGRIPIKDKQKGEDYQKGLADGLKAGRRCYGNDKK